MMRKIIGKIIDIVLPSVKTVSEEGEKTQATDTPTQKVKTISLEQLLGGGEEPPKEPDLRVIGLYSSVEDEKIAELTQALLYLNEMNRLLPEGEEKKPVEFYINTYGGSADDMFAMYDVMQTIMEETEIHTIGVGKVMSAGTLLLAAGTKGKRKIGKHCRVMIHSVIGGSVGPMHQLDNEMREIKVVQELHNRALCEETNLTEKKLRALLKRKVNIYLTAEEAVEYGIADIII